MCERISALVDAINELTYAEMREVCESIADGYLEDGSTNTATIQMADALIRFAAAFSEREEGPL